MPKPIFTTTRVARDLQHEGSTVTPKGSKRPVFKASYLVHYRPTSQLNMLDPDNDIAVAYDI